MSRWGKNIVVPLDALCKEKENTNRPTVARSVGTVGKWGKMGFTSTRTYTLSALPAAVAAAAAAAVAASPGQSPASALDDELSPSVPEPPKPKKFFKSRNAAPPEVIAQIIQQMPRTPTSPMRDSSSSANPSYLNTPVQGREPIKLKLPKSGSAERKKKSPKKAMKATKSEISEDESASTPTKLEAEPKPKKKKEEKKLKPEAPPSRIISRTRKAVNYCEDDDDERMPTPVKDVAVPKAKAIKQTELETTETRKLAAAAPSSGVEPELPPPALPPMANVPSGAGATTPKTPEHPPIVLRISKGTSRLVSTDSEEQPANAAASPHQQPPDTEPVKSRQASTEEVPCAHNNPPTVIHTTPKIIVKPPKPPSPEPPPTIAPPLLLNEHNEINYSTVKISQDKPPKERLKLIIKTDVIRNAIAAAAAAAAAKAAASSQKSAAGGDASALGGDNERPEKEKKQKSKKHKHLKHATFEQLAPATAANVIGSEFKTPSPHLGAEQQQQAARTVISPPALSERDFDSQSSVLGSISSKGNSTPQPLAQTVLEESCVIHSRGSSVITSDLETSQHSSLVAPPSDIESRLESMMMDGEVSQRSTNLIEETEPLQEDILAVLRGEETETGTEEAKVNGSNDPQHFEQMDTAAKSQQEADAGEAEDNTNRRVTRGRGRGTAASTTSKLNNLEAVEQTVVPTTSRTRGRKAAATTPAAITPPAQVQPAAEESSPTKRTTRRGRKPAGEDASSAPASDTNESPNKITAVAAPGTSEPCATSPVAATKRGRPVRNLNNNNNNNLNSSNNNNINKIAASLSAKAGAAEEAAKGANAPQNSNSNNNALTSPRTGSTPPAPRSYGRKRKNQQVTQVLQPSAEEIEEQQQHQATPAKVAALEVTTDLPTDLSAATGKSSAVSPLTLSQHSMTPSLELHETNSNSNSMTRLPSPTSSSPPRRDYYVKDKFKRTLTLDNQANCNAVVASPTGALAGGDEEEQQRGSVKLVISKKKGSIFKSRALVPSDQNEQSTTTKRHLYKHRWDAEANGGTGVDANSPPMKSNETTSAAVARTAADAIFDDFSEDLSASAQSRDNSPMLGKLTRVAKTNTQASANPFELSPDAPSESVTSVKVDRKVKGYYTVVRNVKTAHQIQEIGEYQEMDDDVEYILDALQPHNPTPTRCLSALQLATKCMTPAFRMHVRAHGVVTKFFKALSDANTDLSLGLCTSAIMYILSQEGLNMDLDRDSLELMMNLLESEGVAAPSDRTNYERNQVKVRELCEEIKAQGKAAHLNLDSITVGTLAMETLLSLTSKRAGEWFKEELRTLGGLEHIIKTISENSRPVIECSRSERGINWTQSMLDNMQTVERCMRVLENVTQLNEENQKYMLTYANGAAVDTLCTLYCLCDREITRYASSADSNGKHNPGVMMRELLMPVVKVLINLTHTFNPASALGAEMLGQRTAVIETSFHLLLQTPNYIPDQCVYELSILVLLLLINLTMYTVANRVVIMKAYAPPEYSSHQQNKVTAVQAVMEYFYKCEELARLVEKNTDAILDNTDKNKKKQEEVDETVNNLLKNSGHHMEHTIKGSYAGILIGHLITDNEQNEDIVRQYLRGNGFKEIISVLEKYHTFMDLTCSIDSSAVAHIKSTKKLIDYYRKRDLVYEKPLNLETHHTTSNANANTSVGGGDEKNMASTFASELGAGTTTRSSTQRVYKSYSQR